MRISTPRAALVAALLGLPLAASAQVPGPPPTSPPAGVITIDGTLTDTPYTRLGTNAGGPASQFGATNQLTALYAAVDPAASTLTLGIGGSVVSGNRIIVFVDSRTGGFATGNFAGGDTNTGFPAGVDGFDEGSAFDIGFTADFAVSIGTDGTSYFVNVTELAGTRATEATTPSVDRYIGCAPAGPNCGAPSASIAAAVTSDPADRTKGFEIRIPFAATPSVPAPLASDRRSMQFFALLSNDNANNSFLSNQFITPAGASDGNYGDGAVNFEGAAPDPVSLVWQTIAGRAGYRQLAWPVEGGTVANYAAQNHVQGVTGSFPAGEPNLFTGYNGTTYTPAGAVTDGLFPGRGQFWYHYVRANFPGVVPAGSGFQDLPYTLVAGGHEPQADVVTSFNMYIGFSLGGNPYSLDFDTQGLSVGGGVLVGPLVYAYDPNMGASGGYVTIDRNAAAPTARTVAPMQGFWVETVGNPALSAGAPEARGGISVLYPQASRVAGARALVARTVPQRVLAFDLDRVTDAGLLAEWHAARLAFVEGAGEGTDRFDGGLPPAIGAAGARIGFAATDADGAATYRGQESRAYDLAAPAEARLAVSAPTAGTFRLSWPALDGLPADWALTLTDGDRSTTVDLRTVDHYDFTAAGDWSARFTVRAALRPTAAEAAPAVARLGAATPNPTAGDARVALVVDRAQHVRAELVDALGRRVAVVLDGAVEASLDLVVPTRGLAPGVYVLRVTGDTFAATRQITVTR